VDKVAENLISAVSGAPDDALVTMAHAMLTEVVTRKVAARQKNADGENTPTNTGSPKCLCETCQNEGCRGVEIPYKGKWTMHECEGFTKPLRAGA